MTFLLLLIVYIIFRLVYPHSVYSVKEIPNFLTHEECDYIMNHSTPQLKPSAIYNGNEDRNNSNERLSKQCWLDNHNDMANKISEKVAKLTGTEKEHQEMLQVVRYDEGGHFVPHHDACTGTSEFCKRMDSYIGPRYLTVLIYLNDDYKGGSTVFPRINKSVVPEKGKAVLFYNVTKDGTVINDSLHGGSKVENGNKWIANKWVRLPL
jgi:prolyl 4-hydroxylase